jgi:hypothetical protein
MDSIEAGIKFVNQICLIVKARVSAQASQCEICCRQSDNCMYVCMYLFTANGPKSGGRFT